MQRRSIIWTALGLACLVVALCLWRAGARKPAPHAAAGAVAAGTGLQSGSAQPGRAAGNPLFGRPVPAAPVPAGAAPAVAAVAAATNRFPYRLSNTTEKVGQLAHEDRAILLANALIDTAKPLDFQIPDALKAPADNGSYVVHASGAVDGAFRARLQDAGATIVSYIPNNAFLVRLSAAGAGQLSASGTATVLPYEPYYKLDAALLQPAVEGQPLPGDLGLKVTLFPEATGSAAQIFEQLGILVLGPEERSPFGPVVTILPPATQLAALARLPVVELIEPARHRVAANDLDRPRLGVALDTEVVTNYLGLNGTNVLIVMADGGVDSTHNDLTNRVLGLNLFDASGHGTHVAGTIIGSGVMSSTVSNAIGSLTNLIGVAAPTNTMWRGMAPAGLLYSLDLGQSDAALQEQAALAGAPAINFALTNALISNNSWDYGGDTSYDIASASYDAAVRDALPRVSGPQPVLFVFAAGNAGNGDDTGISGDSGSVLSPATAKNVITVGAIEQNRNVTNVVMVIDTVNNVTNFATPFLGSTDSSNEVAAFSSRGNVGIGVEGDFGRFKPDVVAPGTMVVSDRSPSWDTNAYYFPTNYAFNTHTFQSVDTNTLENYSVFIPDNAISLSINVLTNLVSPSPMPDMLIYVRFADNPTFSTFDLLGTNSVTLNSSLAGPFDIVPLRGGTIFYSVGSATNFTVNFDVQTAIGTTNDDLGLDLLRTNLNPLLGPNYRYESGTSMAAAGVSGMLALVQQFLEQTLGLTNPPPSPALMKALLINGSRPLGAPYDFQVQNSINYQGWGLPALTNIIPAVLTNLVNVGAPAVDPNSMPVRFYDQSATNALATGQSQTWIVTNSPVGQQLPLRITVVWTDPPGNPAAGLKLVNNLDLIVTNLDTGDVFFGNDIPSGGTFNESWDTNAPPPYDVANNVQNVFLAPPLGTNYSVTVLGQRVNVNAVTANTNNVVQDYALVMSMGDSTPFTNVFGISNAVGLSASPPIFVPATNVSYLTTVTNGQLLTGQRVGANPQYANGITGVGNGVTNQWNFYVFTNTAVSNVFFPNVLFLTIGETDLGVPRMGTRAATEPNAVRTNADIDLYVSTNPLLTNLDANAVATAFTSLTRSTGIDSEQVAFSNATPNEVFYIGVKAEDQEGAEYTFLGVATALPFDSRDPNGNPLIQIIYPQTFPDPIPPGSPALPGHNLMIGFTALPDLVQRAAVTNGITHQDLGDLFGVLAHRGKTVVLNNHRPFDNGLTSETFVYDDSGQGDIPGSRRTDGPGSLNDYVGQPVTGTWILNMVDDAPALTGQVDSFGILANPERLGDHFRGVLCGGETITFFYPVPVLATNFTATLTNNGVLDLAIRRGQFPTATVSDKSAVVFSPGGALSITKFDSPPLNFGLYFVQLHNPGLGCVTYDLLLSVLTDLNPAAPFKFLSVGNEPILDDAVTYSMNFVGIDSTVARAEVGVRIDHPRASDLALTLVSPRGTRVLLAENRGGLSTNGYGTGTNLTNAFPTTTSGSAAAETNSINTGANQGTLIISYNFFTVPDTMHVYYDGVRIFDSGLVSGSGSFTIDYGPGTATNLVIIMNEGGNPNATEWQYTVTGIERLINYCVFSEDTNFATIPFKFASPPFASVGSILTDMSSTFEGAAAGSYITPATVDGWSVVSNQVSVVSDPTIAFGGNNFLALASGSITRVLPTQTGHQYTLTYATRGPGIVSWWRGENNGNDSIGVNNGTLQGNIGFAAGMLGQAFSYNGTVGYVDVPNPSGNLNPKAITVDAWINPHLPLDPSPDASPIVKMVQGSSTVNQGYSLEFDNTGLSHVNFWVNLTGGVGWQRSPVVAVPTGNWTYVVGSYDGRTISIYTNGVLVGSNPFAGTIVSAGNDLRIGGDPSNPSRFDNGGIDEPSVYQRSLSASEIRAIYNLGIAGRTRADPLAALPQALAEARLTIPGVVTTNFSANNTNWALNTITFTAPQANLALQIDGLEPGVLLDSFSLTEAVPGTYYLPEETLDKVVGEPSKGNWELEVVDNRAGPYPVTNVDLVSWQLSLRLDTVTPLAIPLSHAIAVSNSVDPFSIRYFRVDVPAWAQFATNTLFNVSGGSVNLLWNQNIEPTGTGAGDFPLMPAVTTSNQVTLSTNGTVPTMLAGATYYLGVQNTNATPVNFSIEVDFDITTLFNAVPVTSTLAATGIQRYFQYDVSTNAYAVAFQLFNLNGNVDLYARKGAPLPDNSLGGFDYDSVNPGTNNESIIVASNSTPVALSPGRWYLGVFNNDIIPVTYTIMATETGPPIIIPLVNAVPFTNTVGPGVLLTNFYSFTITSTNTAALFELYNLSSNADLTLDRDVLPWISPFFAGSFNPGTNTEQIVLRTNPPTPFALNATNLNAVWYLGVPNRTGGTVTYTIRAVVATNGILVSGLPLRGTLVWPSVGSTNGPTLTWPSVLGESYEVLTSTNIILPTTNWTVLATITNAPAPVTSFTDPAPITGVPILFYRIVQVPVP